jgi:hypothetical protein
VWCLLLDCDVVKTPPMAAEVTVMPPHPDPPLPVLRVVVILMYRYSWA